MKKQKVLWTAAAVCAVLGAACRAVPGVRFAGLLFWCLTALLIVFAALEQMRDRAWARWAKRVLLALVCVGLIAFGYLEALVIRGAHTDAGAQDAGTVAVNHEQALSGSRVSVDETADETHRLVREHSMQVKREIIEVGLPRTLTFCHYSFQ